MLAKPALPKARALYGPTGVCTTDEGAAGCPHHLPRRAGLLDRRSGTFLSPEVCQRWRKDDDWPTWDPVTVVPAGAKRAGDVLRDFLSGRTVFFIGDSVNSLVYQAFACDIAREGYIPVVRIDSTTTFLQARGAGVADKGCASFRRTPYAVVTS